MQIIDEGSWMQVVLSGELTMEVIEDLKLEFEEIFERPWQVLAAEVSQVRFMDSSGIGFLTALNNRSHQENRIFCLLSPSQQVAKTLKLVNLWDLFYTVHSKEELEERFLSN